MILLNSKKINTFNEKNKINFSAKHKLAELRSKIKQYENTINFKYMCCPCCKSDKLISYGTYLRYVVICDITCEIKIKRVKCKCCNKTHAIIPDFIKPYFNYESSFIDFCVIEKYERKKTNKEMEKIGISRQILRQWIKRFLDYINYIKTTFKLVKQKISTVIFKEEFDKKFYESNRMLYFKKIPT